MATRIDIILCEDRLDALHLHYPNQTSPHGAHVYLSCETGELWAAPNFGIGNAVPMAVHHERVLRWTIPILTGIAANDLLRKIAPLAEMVLSGASIAWDGQNNRGRFSPDAENAIERIDEICNREPDEEDLLNLWDAEDWYGAADDVAALLGITADTTDGEIERLAAADTLLLETEEKIVMVGAEDFLLGVRDGLRSQELAEQVRASLQDD
jgi:hypothetical protein